MPPEYLQSGRISAKTDAYAFGIFIMLMLTNKQLSPQVRLARFCIIASVCEEHIMTMCRLVVRLDVSALALRQGKLHLITCIARYNTVARVCMYAYVRRFCCLQR